MTDTATSPFRLNLDQQRKRAKDLVRAARAGDDAALQRFRDRHPRGAAAPLRLTEAQLVVARELGLPSWPKLRAHIDAMQHARDRIAVTPPPDADMPTLHIRCGSDLRAPLGDAGFAGAFLECADPLCQGPVTEAADWLQHRARFLADAYGAALGRTLEQITRDLEQAEAGLRNAEQHYPRVVLWFEHDSYDQLILARCLAQFAAAPPRQLDLVSVGRFPGTARFIGLGQLPPETLRLLWADRRPVTAAQLRAGTAVWQALRAADPTALAALAATGIQALPALAAAARRHCQELPWQRDGLSLTERLVLQSVQDRPKTVGAVFRDLMQAREKLPWLGDVMLHAIIEAMKRADQPVFTASFAGDARDWPHETLTLADLGYAVLAGARDWLSLNPPERWLGGVRIVAGAPCWRWDEQAATPRLV